MKANHRRNAGPARLTSPAAVRFDAGGGDGTTVEATIASNALLADGLQLDLAGADLSRVAMGAVPVLLDHQNAANAVVGGVSSVRVDGDRLVATLRVTDPDMAARIDRGDPINVSVGFNVVEQSGTRATKWQLTEVSLVGVGLDPVAGVQRDQAADRQRSASLVQLAQDFGAMDLLPAAITRGDSPETFAASIRTRTPVGPGSRTVGAPAIVRSVGDPEDFLLTRMFLHLANGESGPEVERCRDAATLGGRGASHRAYNIPDEVLRTMRVPRHRVLGTDSTSTGDHLVPTDHLDEQFIEALRSRTFLDRVGARVLNGLSGDTEVPRQTGVATASWLDESTTAVTETDQTFDDLTLSPKEHGAATTYSRKLLIQSSPDVEGIVRSDFIDVLNRSVESAVLAGSGASNQPAGLTSFGAALFARHVDATNGTTMGFAEAVAMLQAIAQANADAERAVWVTSPIVAARLMTTPKIETEPEYLMAGGMLVERPVVQTTLATSGATQGSSTGNTGHLFVGDWSECLVGRFSSIDVLVNPYSLDKERKIRVTAFEDVDVNFRHVKSFAANLSVVHD